MQLDPELIRTLRTVDELRSVSRAARALHVTQSAVSARLRRLGEIAGQPVVCAAGRGIEVTPHGSFVLRTTSALVDVHDAAVRGLTDNVEQTYVKVLVNEVFFTTEVLALARAMRRRFPTVTIEWTVDAAAHDNQRYSDVDFDVTIHQIRLDEVLRSDIVVWTDSLAWIQGVDQSFGIDEPLPLITFGADCFYRPLIERALRASEISYSFSVACPSYAGVIEAVRAGLGVAVVSGRNCSPGTRPWADAPDDALPRIAQVCRVRLGADPIVFDLARLLASASPGSS